MTASPHEPTSRQRRAVRYLLLPTVVAALTVFAGGCDTPHHTSAVDVDGVYDLIKAPPAGFTGKKLAGAGTGLQPMEDPEASQYHFAPTGCTPSSSPPLDKKLAHASVRFTSDRSIVVVTAYDAGTKAPAVNRQANCATMTFTGPDGVRGLVGSAPTDPIPDTDRNEGRLITTQKADAVSESYAYVVRFDHYAVAVMVLPASTSITSINPDPGRDVLKRTVAAIR